jgi:hypothetical protein
MPSWGSKSITYMSDLRVLHEGEGKLCFISKTYAKTPIDMTEGKR